MGYIKCLVAATATEQLVETDRPKEIRGLTPDEIARMEREMESVGREFKLIEESHGKNVLNLVLVVAYLRKLLENARVGKIPIAKPPRDSSRVSQAGGIEKPD